MTLQSQAQTEFVELQFDVDPSWFETIPEHVAVRPIWCLWTWREYPGQFKQDGSIRREKVPYAILGWHDDRPEIHNPSKPDNITRYGVTLADAIRALISLRQRGRQVGIGVVLKANDRLSCIDVDYLDHPQGRALVDQAVANHTLCETSISDTGAHIYSDIRNKDQFSNNVDHEWGEVFIEDIFIAVTAKFMNGCQFVPDATDFLATLLKPRSAITITPTEGTFDLIEAGTFDIGSPQGLPCPGPLTTDQITQFAAQGGQNLGQWVATMCQQIDPEFMDHINWPHDRSGWSNTAFNNALSCLQKVVQEPQACHSFLAASALWQGDTHDGDSRTEKGDRTFHSTWHHVRSRNLEHAKAHNKAIDKERRKLRNRAGLRPLERDNGSYLPAQTAPPTETEMADLDPFYTPSVMDGTVEPVNLFTPPDPPQLTREMIPRVIFEAANEQHQKSGVDFNGFAVSMIAVATGAIDSRQCIAPDPNQETWKEHPILWFLGVATPSAKKSVAFKDAAKPLRRMQSRLDADHDEAVKKYEAELQAYKDAGKVHKAWSKTETGPEPDVPPLPHAPTAREFWFSDYTIEEVARLLDENPQGVIKLRDEGGSHFASMGQYTSSASRDRSDYNEMFDGGAARIGRVSLGRRSVDSAALSMLMFIQSDLINNELSKLKSDDGHLHRYLTMFMRKREPSPNGPFEQGSYKADCDLIERLPIIGLGPLERERRGAFMFDNEAQALWTKYTQWIFDMHDVETLNAFLFYHVEKLNHICARIALVFHLIESAQNPDGVPSLIPRSTLQMAVNYVVFYAVPNAYRFYVHGLSGATDDDVIKVAEALLSKPDMDRVTLRDFQRMGNATKKIKGERGEEVMQHLCRLGWVEALSIRDRATKSTPAWSINKLIHTRYTEHAAEVKARRQRVSALMQNLGVDTDNG